MNDHICLHGPGKADFKALKAWNENSIACNGLSNEKSVLFNATWLETILSKFPQIIGNGIDLLSSPYFFKTAVISVSLFSIATKGSPNLSISSSWKIEYGDLNWTGNVKNFLQNYKACILTEMFNINDEDISSFVIV